MAGAVRAVAGGAAASGARGRPGGTKPSTSKQFDVRSGVSVATQEAIRSSPAWLEQQAAFAKKFSVHPAAWRSAALIQNAWRGYATRQRVPVKLHETIHLGYELFVMKKRLHRRSMLVGFFQHLAYMIILMMVIGLQSAFNVSSRFELEHTVDDMIKSIKTPSGLTFEGVGDIGDAWLWVRDGLFAQVSAKDPNGLFFLRTYNQLVGSIRIETMRVSDASCPYRDEMAARGIASRVRNETGGCYGALSGAGDSTAFGPEYDASRYASQSMMGENRFIVDLGRDPKFAAIRLNELITSDFLSKNTRELKMSLLLYNNAFPMFCATSITVELLRTGERLTLTLPNITGESEISMNLPSPPCSISLHPPP